MLLVFDALAETAGRQKFPGECLVSPGEVDGLVQVDAIAEPAVFENYNLDEMDFSQELEGEECLLSAVSVSAQDLLKTVVV